MCWLHRLALPTARVHKHTHTHTESCPHAEPRHGSVQPKGVMQFHRGRDMIPKLYLPCSSHLQEGCTETEGWMEAQRSSSPTPVPAGNLIPFQTRRTALGTKPTGVELFSCELCRPRMQPLRVLSPPPRHTVQAFQNALAGKPCVAQKVPGGSGMPTANSLPAWRHLKAQKHSDTSLSRTPGKGRRGWPLAEGELPPQSHLFRARTMHACGGGPRTDLVAWARAAQDVGMGQEALPEAGAPTAVAVRDGQAGGRGGGRHIRAPR